MNTGRAYFASYTGAALFLRGMPEHYSSRFTSVEGGYMVTWDESGSSDAWGV